MSRYHGKGGVIYLSTTGSGTASLMTGANFTINFATDRVEVTSFGDPNKTYVQGLKDIQGSLNAFWDNSDTKFFTAADSADGCKLYLYPSSLVTGSYFYGPAWLDGNLEVSVSGAVSITGSFAANGAWGRVASQAEAMRVTGPSAELRWGYRLVARLGPWRSERTGHGGSFSADGVVIVDAFGITQRPLQIVIPTRAHSGAWVWPVRDVVIENGRMSGTVIGSEAGGRDGTVSIRAAERDSAGVV